MHVSQPSIHKEKSPERASRAEGSLRLSLSLFSSPRPLFSCRYNSQIFYLLSFDIHANWWGVYGGRPVEFLKKNFNYPSISRESNNLSGVGFTSHESPITSHRTRLTEHCHESLRRFIRTSL